MLTWVHTLYLYSLFLLIVFYFLIIQNNSFASKIIYFDILLHVLRKLILNILANEQQNAVFGF